MISCFIQFLNLEITESKENFTDILVNKGQHISGPRLLKVFIPWARLHRKLICNQYKVLRKKIQVMSLHSQVLVSVAFFDSENIAILL